MDFDKARFNMVEQQIRPWDVLDFDLLDALDNIPREEFVQPDQRGYAYADTALTLPNGSMMLEPKIVARMVQGLELGKDDRVLEIGTGSGYATALLATLGGRVHSYDMDETQLDAARRVLEKLGYKNIELRHGDGLMKNGESYDAIYVGGALRELPEGLRERLNKTGRMVVVTGHAPVQRCRLIRREGEGFSEKVLFDTMTSYLDEKRPKKKSKFTF